MITRIIRALLYFPKTLYINLRCLPLCTALKLPIIIMSPSTLKGLKRGSITIEKPISPGMIKIGTNSSQSSGIQTNRRTIIIIKNNGSIIFKGKAGIGRGSSIVTKGSIVLGENFSCNVNCFFSAHSRIEIGKNNLFGWNVSIRDSDGHMIFDENGGPLNMPKPVVIGNNVWIASFVDVLKGAKIQNGTVIGYRSLVTKEFTEGNCILSGIPASIKKEGISWDIKSY